LFKNVPALPVPPPKAQTISNLPVESKPKPKKKRSQPVDPPIPPEPVNDISPDVGLGRRRSTRLTNLANGIKSTKSNKNHHGKKLSRSSAAMRMDIDGMSTDEEGEEWQADPSEDEEDVLSNGLKRQQNRLDPNKPRPNPKVSQTSFSLSLAV
jgi:hypothetical protein